MQDILTYIIVILCFGYTFYQFIKLFIPNKNNANETCGGGCSSCKIKDEILIQYQMKNLSLDKKNDEA
jgi:attachment p12 family protein